MPTAELRHVLAAVPRPWFNSQGQALRGLLTLGAVTDVYVRGELIRLTEEMARRAASAKGAAGFRAVAQFIRERSGGLPHLILRDVPVMELRFYDREELHAAELWADVEGAT